MTTVTRRLKATPEQVWEVLADGWLYPLWVVGATRMRAVDETWPSPGSKLHHSAGSWPLVLDDDTEVTDCQPPARLALRAKGWPLGEAAVTIRLSPAGAETEVAIDEVAVKGPGALVPHALQAPGVAWRNRETLQRLAFLVEGRTR